ncbi:MAG TPA: TadE/TadG family type IV pilus assembly protein [Anaerolineales bacterium]|nr:TadE/TadG family type IV pilus assembly protein [Anaerolineales bacterium]
MKRMKSERGQSLVELGVSLVVLLYLLSGAVEFGILFFQFVQLRDAAQEGALYGSMNPPANASDTTAINSIVTRAKYSSPTSSPIDLINDPAVGVDVTVTDGLYCEGGSLEVEVTYPHRIFMPFMPQLLGRTEIPLTATVVDTILTPICGP